MYHLSITYRSRITYYVSLDLIDLVHSEKLSGLDTKKKNTEFRGRPRENDH